MWGQTVIIRTSARLAGDADGQGGRSGAGTRSLARVPATGFDLQARRVTSTVTCMSLSGGPW
jgi:hypothetical protein